MAFSINDLSATISSRGIQKSSSFSCILTLPPSMTEEAITSDLQYRINSVNLPGTAIGVDEIRHKGFGLSEKRPMSVNYDDVSMTIICDGQGLVQKLMKEWNEKILPSALGDVGADDLEYFEYPSEYYGGLEIYVYDLTGEIHSTYNFIQPFPTQVGSAEMSWENSNSILLLPVTFSYRSYRLNSNHSGFIN